MKTGTIILVQTLDGFLPKAIQWFQKFDDPVAGVNNHAMLYFRDSCEDLVLEGGVKKFDDIEMKSRQARVVFNPLSNYTDHPEKYKLTFLEPTFEYDEILMRRIMFMLEGLPYEYHNLLGDQIVQYVSFMLGSKKGWWIGRKGMSASGRVICQELAQLPWYLLTRQMWGENNALFKDFYRGLVSRVTDTPHFKDINYKQLQP